MPILPHSTKTINHSGLGHNARYLATEDVHQRRCATALKHDVQEGQAADATRLNHAP
jgi:hypothetical protein